MSRCEAAWNPLRTGIHLYMPTLGTSFMPYTHKIVPRSLVRISARKLKATSQRLARSDLNTHISEHRRKHRQTLFKIKDDVEFQQVFETHARLEAARHAAYEFGGHRQMLAGTWTDELDVMEGKAWQESLRAWFVTRELVQGERRYERLLARGIAVSSYGDLDCVARRLIR
jgi:hypothetical protein